MEETGFRTDTLCVDDVVKATSEVQFFVKCLSFCMQEIQIGMQKSVSRHQHLSLIQPNHTKRLIPMLRILL